MLDRLRKAQIPLLTQITVPYVILAILVAAGGTYIITQVVVDSVEERFTNQLIDTTLLAQEGIVREESEILESLRLVSHTVGVAEALVASDTSSLRDLVLPLAFNAQVEALVFLKSSGQAALSVRLDEETRQYLQLTPSDPYNSNEFLQRVLAGESDELGDKFGGFVETTIGDYLFIAGPVQDSNGRLVGTAMIGQSAASLANILREETLGHLTFYTVEGAPLVSTLPQPDPLPANDIGLILARQDQQTYQRTLTSEEITYNELVTPLEIRAGEDIGVMGVALATHFLVQTSQITRSNTLILMSVALLMVLVIGAVVAGRITRPIRDLKEAAVRISGGNLSVKVDDQRRDEVGVLAQSFNEMVDSLNESRRELLDTYDKTIEGWAMALDLRDHETEGHSRRVTQLAFRLGKKLGLSRPELEALYRGGLLHDIGKIAVPDSILLKQGKLTAAETKLIQQHPLHAKNFMEKIEFLKPAMDVPYAHHEKWDGSGYPHGLKGEAIPLLARVFAVADVWDAITTDRPYRKAMSFSEALDVMHEGKGKHFDPKIVDAFIQMLGEMLKEKQAS